MKWPLHKKIGIILIIAGIAPFIIVELMDHAHDWVPLDVPVVLKPGQFRSPAFNTDLNSRYLLSLAADQLSGPGLDKEECMMGFTTAPNILYCNGVRQTAEFDWQIVSDSGVVLESGRYKPNSLSTAKMGFAEFQGQRGASQSIVLTIRRDGEELNIHHPRIMVEAGPEAFEALPLVLFLSRIWAVAVGVLGLLVILLPTGWKALNKLRSRAR